MSLREGIYRGIALHSVETISHTFIFEYMGDLRCFILFRACRNETTQELRTQLNPALKQGNSMDGIGNGGG